MRLTGARVPALDGLRGVAVLLVLVNHLGSPHAPALGQAGVTAFFVLSGFLITTLLVEERRESGRVSFRGFYARRARRLLPVLVVCVAVTCVVLIPIGAVRLWEPVAALGYIMNFVEAAQGYTSHALGHTWSLAIEEQFYLLWPPLLILLPRRMSAILAAVVVAATPVWRLMLLAGGAEIHRVTYGLDTRGDGLMVGCLLALWLHGRRATLGQGNSWVAGGCTVALVVIGLAWSPAWGPTMAAAAAAAVIYAATRTAPIGWLTWRWLQWVGVRSYGLYLWHVPVTAIVLAYVPPLTLGVRAVLVLTVSLVVTALSWRYVERPLLRPRLLQAEARVRELSRPG